MQFGWLFRIVALGCYSTVISKFVAYATRIRSMCSGYSLWTQYSEWGVFVLQVTQMARLVHNLFNIVSNTFMEILVFWGVTYIKCIEFNYTSRYHFRCRNIELLNAFALMELCSKRFWTSFYWHISRVGTDCFTCTWELSQSMY